MIIKGLFELVYALLSIVFAPINLPDLPAGIQNVFDDFLDVLISAVDLCSLIIDFDVVKWLIPVVIAVANFDKLWSLIMFILKKIPFLGIE